MQVLGIAIGSAIALIVAVPVVYVVSALVRAVIGGIRSRGQSPNATPPHQREGFVDSLAWSLRWGEVANADERESIEGMGGPTPPGGP